MRRLALLTVALGAWLASSVQPAVAQVLVPFGAASYSNPRYVASPPGDPNHVYVVEGDGTIRVITGGVPQGPAFLDVSGDVCFATDSPGCAGESGMSSMAFPPDYATSGLFYVFYTRDDAIAGPPGHLLVVREFHALSATDADESSARDVLVIPHPNAQNHNGGQLQFGPDGYLYISTGDGGGGNDPDNNAQNRDSLLGKLLRIDPRDPDAGGSATHTNPTSNPFAGVTTGADEIYAYGLRNPYRFSFDRLAGDLIIGDVGQGAFEEIDFAANGSALGANYGWDCFEGMALGGSSGQPQCTSFQGTHTPPVFQYENPPAAQAAINGGYVVRDGTLPTLLGRYLYADSVGAFPEMRSISLFPGGASGDASTGLTGGTASFGEDSCGHIYVAYFSGVVDRIQSSASPPACQPQSASAPPSGGGAADAKGPLFSVDLKKARRAAARGDVTLVVSCDEACSLTGTGKIKLPGKDIGLDPDSGRLAPGQTGALVLGLSGKEATRLADALADGARAKALLTLAGTDLAGNRSSASYSVRQKR